MSTSSFPHLTTAILYKPGKYRYRPSPVSSLMFCIRWLLTSLFPRAVQDAGASQLCHETRWVNVLSGRRSQSRTSIFISSRTVAVFFNVLCCFWQASIWGWTSSWWLMCPAWIWGPLDFLWCPVLSIVLRPLHRNISAFFLRADVFTVRRLHLLLMFSNSDGSSGSVSRYGAKQNQMFQVTFSKKVHEMHRESKSVIVLKLTTTFYLFGKKAQQHRASYGYAIWWAEIFIGHSLTLFKASLLLSKIMLLLLRLLYFY